ncbi:hypothetical protein, partial [Burkholderia diffusa]|uniref:hypothetical protein n=1 Tax=Burkholderia diffusa TaxID=488732 RepID=UPI001C2D0903
SEIFSPKAIEQIEQDHCIHCRNSETQEIRHDALMVPLSRHEQCDTDDLGQSLPNRQTLTPLHDGSTI